MVVVAHAPSDNAASSASCVQGIHRTEESTTATDRPERAGSTIAFVATILSVVASCVSIYVV